MFLLHHPSRFLVKHMIILDPTMFEEPLHVSSTINYHVSRRGHTHGGIVNLFMLSEQAQLGPIGWRSWELDRLGPDQLKKSGAGSAGSRQDIRTYLPRMNILGVSVSSSFMSIEVLLSTSIYPLRTSINSAHWAHCMYYVFW